MSYTYPQIFHLERPPFTFALSRMPNIDLCVGGGNAGTGQPPPCLDCPDKLPFAPQDIFDLQWASPITNVVIRLPDGSTFPVTGIVSFEGHRLRISFCHAPPCFTLEINNECTLLGFERIECFVDCGTQPSPDPPTPLPPVLATPQASFVQFEHVRMSDNVAFSTNIIGVSDAEYSYVRYPNEAITFLASSLNSVGGAVADHLHATVTGAIVNASITQGIGSFAGWVFDVPSGVIVGYTSSGTYAPAPLPPQFISGNPTSPNISFVVPAGTHIRARALFGEAVTPPMPE